MTASLKKRAVTAGLWSSLDIGMRFGIQFLVSIVLARLLSPADFGVYAITAVFLALSMVLVDGGFSTALIQRSEVSRQEQTAVFWCNLLIAILLAAIVVAVAPLVGRLFGYPVLRSLLYVVAGVTVVNALASVPATMLQRELRFDLLAKIGLAASCTSGVLAVVAASNGAGIWSLAYQAIAYAIVNAGLLWIIGTWRPVRGLHLYAARPLARFGMLVALSSLLEVAYAQGSSLIIGKLYGARDLGFFNRGQSLQNLPANVLAAIVTRVALPIFSTKSQDDVTLRKGMRLAQGVVMFLNLPLMGLLAAMPDLVIDVLYGPKWLPAAPILRILAVGGVLFPLHAINLQLLLAKGRSDLYLKAELAKKVVGISFAIAGSLFGVLGLAMGQTLFVYVAFFINASVAGRTIGYGPFAQLRDLSGAIVLTLATCAVVVTLRPMLGFDNFINLVVLTAIGGLFFAGSGLALRIGTTRDLLAMVPLRRLRGRSPA